MNWVLRKIDTLIYVFIGPFGVLYVFPLAFLDWERRLGIAPPEYARLDLMGVALMTLGNVLAIWCALLMFKGGGGERGSVSPFQRPVAVIASGPYRFVRHPMMWAINLILIGEALFCNSLMIGLWFVIWCRFASLYISRYEEPYLISVFADAYLDYCKKTPRWFPFLRSHQ